MLTKVSINECLYPKNTYEIDIEMVKNIHI